MKNIIIGFCFILLSAIYYLPSAFAVSPHPLIYDTGPLPPEWQALVSEPRLSVPVLPVENVTQQVITTGTVKVAVLLIEFTDVKASAGHSKSYFDNLLFSQNQGYDSMYDYYKEVSDSQTSLTGTTGARWYTANNVMRYYGADGSQVDNLYGDISNLVIEAVQKADADVNFAQYDTDGNGIVDHLIIIHAGNGQENTGNPDYIWSHSGSFTTTVGGQKDENGYLTSDGVHVKTYTMLSEYSPIGTFAHEFGHDLGLPDLYNTQSIGGTTVVGDWDLMDGGSWLGPGKDGSKPAHIGAWGKKYLGWVTPTTLNGQQIGVSLYPSGAGNCIYKVPLLIADDPINEYFLLEYRQKANFDLYLPGEGMLIWHIDDSILNYETTDVYGNQGKAYDLNVVNSEPYVPHRAVDIVEADKTDKSSEASDPFPGSRNMTTFGSPDNAPYNGRSSDFTMLNIGGASGSYMTFDIYQAVFDQPLDITRVYSYPNPSTAGSVKIRLVVTNILEAKDIFLKIFDLNGQLIREAKTGEITTSSLNDNKVVYEYSWDGKNDNGEKVASGVYLYRFKASNKEKIGKIAIAK